MFSSSSSRPLQAIASANETSAPLACGNQSVVAKKNKRKVVYNACEHCRWNKSKCSGIAPCARCVKDNVECVFTGRAHERARQELLASEQNLAKIRQELQDSQMSLVASRQETLDIQRDLTTSQLDFLASEQHVREQQSTLDRVFELLRVPHQPGTADVRALAFQSTDAADFSARLRALPPHIKQAIGLSTKPGDSLHDQTGTPPLTPVATNQAAHLVTNNTHVTHHYADDFEDSNMHQFAPIGSQLWPPHINNALSTMESFEIDMNVDGPEQHLAHPPQGYNNP